ncbi:conserved Plasmodium protein, unknown function [Plasmodium relictum]|uniref:Uncharacterized protein n=1 Tax=Plasmodium relictum TaxID=85471 RepID=A0A1J1H5L1_PLARL|nr:conserved Plasmodium protein, unknown function [Plasmodium relictum]CRH00221.1 conserved Plasmodium protein, unknown function [Plasmodium relictum]
MCEKVESGLFYKDCNLYIGEYILQDKIQKEDNLEKSKDDISKKKNDLPKEISKNIYDEKDLYKSNKKNEEIDKEKNNNDNKNDSNIIFHGYGKYIKKNEIFVGVFEKNAYRKGIWIKYKNIHNLFFYMNIHEMILKEEKNINIENFKNLLYLPLKEINIYIGEFDDNMFNGFSLYYFYPFLYVGYFINNSMTGYGYIFHISSLNEINYSKKNNIFSYSNLFNYLFVREMKSEKSTNVKDSKKKNEKNKLEEESVAEIKSVNERKNEKIDIQNNKNSDDIKDSEDDNLQRKLLFDRIYEQLEKMVKEINYKESNDNKSEKEKNKDKNNLIDKIEKDIYKNLKLNIKKKNRINKIKKILQENKKENFFDIFNYITYDNLFFKGFFYKNKFSNNDKEQTIYKNMFIQLYKDNIISKIEMIRNNILNDLKPDDIHISEHNDLYVFEKKRKIILKKKKTDIKNEVRYDIRNNINEDIKENLIYENLKNLVDWTILKNIFELTLKNNIEYFIDVITDEKIFKYKNKFRELNIEEKYLNKATLNLNGYFQLVILNFKCKGEILFNLNTSKCNFQNIYKIKIFLVSSDKSSIIKYNTFNLYYIFVYVRNLDKKNKNKIKKKKN